MQKGRRPITVSGKSTEEVMQEKTTHEDRTQEIQGRRYAPEARVNPRATEIGCTSTRRGSKSSSRFALESARSRELWCCRKLDEQALASYVAVDDQKGSVKLGNELGNAPQACDDPVGEAVWRCAMKNAYELQQAGVEWWRAVRGSDCSGELVA
ncbi:hypothetical protein PC123_g16484 [Phytophthora cactorum]|nr:hypothetical protein PC120_g18376 [Phytophthora cactorum]KAG4048191.1 hypothetical protein PC123_g16484 [Phytophthora cactorum]